MALLHAVGAPDADAACMAVTVARHAAATAGAAEHSGQGVDCGAPVMTTPSADDEKPQEEKDGCATHAPRAALPSRVAIGHAAGAADTNAAAQAAETLTKTAPRDEQTASKHSSARNGSSGRITPVLSGKLQCTRRSAREEELRLHVLVSSLLSSFLVHEAAYAINAPLFIAGSGIGNM